MKISIKQPNGQYKCFFDTEVMEVTIREAFIGPRFVTSSGEELVVIMRDDGFEVHYSGEIGETGFDAGWMDFKNGVRTVRGKTDG